MRKPCPFSLRCQQYFHALVCSCGEGASRFLPPPSQSSSTIVLAEGHPSSGEQTGRSSGGIPLRISGKQTARRTSTQRLLVATADSASRAASDSRPASVVFSKRTTCSGPWFSAIAPMMDRVPSLNFNFMPFHAEEWRRHGLPTP